MELTLSAISEDAPSGENLEYEAVFQDLELLARPPEDQQMGDEVVAGEAAADSDIAAKAHEVLALSHDLRAAVILAGAEVRMNGFAGFANVTTYMRGCLEDYWESCHPQLDEEDDDDPTMRVNAVLGLAARTTMLSALRRAPLTKSPAFGMIGLRDIEIANGDITPTEEDKNLDGAAISAAFQDTDGDDLAAILGTVETALGDVKAIDAVFSEKTPGQGPDLDELIKTLSRIQSRLKAESGGEEETAAEEEEGASPAAAAGGSGGGGAIQNPNDVARALDRIIAYYSANEPSSPVPLVLARAKRLIGADFMTIMKDMAPDGISNVESVSGITDGDGYDE